MTALTILREWNKAVIDFTKTDSDLSFYGMLAATKKAAQELAALDKYSPSTLAGFIGIHQKLAPYLELADGFMTAHNTQDDLRASRFRDKGLLNAVNLENEFFQMARALFTHKWKENHMRRHRSPWGERGYDLLDAMVVTEQIDRDMIKLMSALDDRHQGLGLD